MRITLSKNNELETEKITIDASDIQVIKIRGRNAVWKGTLIGAGVGGAMGAIVGLITYEPCNECFLDFGPGYNIGGGFVLGALSGTLVGTFIGISKKKYVINGNLEEFNKVKIKINGY